MSLIIEKMIDKYEWKIYKKNANGQLALRKSCLTFSSWMIKEIWILKIKRHFPPHTDDVFKFVTLGVTEVWHL